MLTAANLAVTVLRFVAMRLWVFLRRAPDASDGVVAGGGPRTWSIGVLSDPATGARATTRSG